MVIPPGNAILLNGVTPTANREIGVPGIQPSKSENSSRGDLLRMPFSFPRIPAGSLHLFLRGGRKQAVHTQVHREPSIMIREISDDRQGRSKTRDLLAAEKRDHFRQIGVRHF